MSINIEAMRKNVFEYTEKIVKEQGPRLAGSKESLNTADFLYNELKPFSDQLCKQSFAFNKGAFLGWIRWCVVLFGIGLVFVWLEAPIISLFLMLVAVFIFYMQFVRYMPLMDKMFKPAEGRNVIGYLEPSKKVRQQVIISGHHDSARIFNFLAFQPKLYSLRTTTGILALFLLLISSIALSLPITQEYHFIISVVLSGIGLIFVLPMWFFASKKGTPGAGDNLASSMIALEVFKFFAKEKQTENGLAHTRLIFASFDAEEEGLRGSRAFAERYSGEFLLAPTYNLNIECLYDSSALTFLTSDVNGTVELSQELALSLQKVGEAYSIPTQLKKIGFLAGGTDAAELAKRGVNATTLIGMPFTNRNRAASYHTMKDTLEAVSPQAVDNTITMFTTWVKEIDAK